MHFEILVEDMSGKRALEELVPRIIGTNNTFSIHSYRGIGRIPKNLKTSLDASKRILLDRLPQILRGYGRTYSSYPDDYEAVIIVVCDLDSKCLKEFRQELLALVDACFPKPETRFCIAVEEGESWFLGDLSAIKEAYPKAKDIVLKGYVNDSICGTWETLADAVYSGGAAALSKQGWQAIGAEKYQWATKIAPVMDLENNHSPSFNYFVQKLRDLNEAAT